MADRRVLQDKSIFGCEPKSLPYLLCQMNLVLHGLDAPQIDPGNRASFQADPIFGELIGVDVILTNPPFGGEEEKGFRAISLKTNKPPKPRCSSCNSSCGSCASIPSPRWGEGGPEGEVFPADAAVVVPNGTLFGDGVCGRIKEELLKEFNLHAPSSGCRTACLRHYQHPDEHSVL